MRSERSVHHTKILYDGGIERTTTRKIRYLLGPLRQLLQATVDLIQTTTTTTRTGSAITAAVSGRVSHGVG